MDEFNSRIDVQRKALDIINAKIINEPLNGLSKSAIDRWAKCNGISEANRAMHTLLSISEGVLFLANKSQQQITDEYRKTSSKIDELLQELRNAWD